MPRHKQVTECLRGVPVSKYCTCQHCTLGVCSVCGAYEGGLTTDCPGVNVDFDRQKEVHETLLDYTDERGWHQGEPMKRRVPQFEPEAPPPTRPLDHTPRYEKQEDAFFRLFRIVGCSCGWSTPSGTRDSEDAFALHVAALRTGSDRIAQRRVNPPSIDWQRVDRTQELKHELAEKAIAWVLADRVADDHAASLKRVEDEVDGHLRRGREQDWLSDERGEMLKKLEYEKIGFKLACQRAEKCDDEWRQMARRLVAELEKRPLVASPRRVLHVLWDGHALCGFSSETPSRWPPGHEWTSIGELGEGATKVADITCEACRTAVKKEHL